jgi:hypothetical protein
LIDIPGKYDFKPYSFGFQKNSPYLGLFDFYLNQLKEKGTMQQIIQEYVAKTPECPDYSGNPLGMVIDSLLRGPFPILTIFCRNGELLYSFSNVQFCLGIGYVHFFAIRAMPNLAQGN